ncbi:60S ribosomal protein L7a [Sciurus carolinensis]|uniref:60S ribosomal protein L7a n=1 Tax=Sciurus carolinensis TaxID=30640 RepID=A0AA41N2L5_SCICA|nr:60S ribosomal protein L7a [Sciurus carolinensis]
MVASSAEKQAAGKGDNPTKGPQVLQTGVNTVNTLVENKAPLVVIAYDVDSISWLSSCPPCVARWESLTASRGHPVHRKMCTTAASTQVNSEEEGALAKLVEAIRTNYNDRYEIQHHWGDNVLGPKSVAPTATLEKAKAKEFATKLG